MQRNKVLTILLSLIIAIGLWVYVVSTITPDDSLWVYRIPVTFANEDGLFSDRNLVLASGRDSTVNLRFNGKRRDLHGEWEAEQVKKEKAGTVSLRKITVEHLYCSGIL